MSDELKLCERHRQESNQSHFAAHNCDYCKLNKKVEAERDAAAKLAEALKDAERSLESIYMGRASDTNEAWEMREYARSRSYVATNALAKYERGQG